MLGGGRCQINGAALRAIRMGTVIITTLYNLRGARRLLLSRPPVAAKRSKSTGEKRKIRPVLLSG